MFAGGLSSFACVLRAMLVPQSWAKHGTRWFMTGQIPVVRINSPLYNADA
jgi:hypothetical protein